MEESALIQPSSELCMPCNSKSSLLCSTNIKKQKEFEISNVGSHTDDNDLFGVSSKGLQPPPYEYNETAVMSSSSSQFDVALIYDSQTDYYAATELKQMIGPQNLRIFDVARDTRPGISQRKMLEMALKFCKFTCIVVTRNFNSNFWLKFQTDMAIQDMIQNYQKQYTIVAVVMDYGIKDIHLPLDLQTLSPIYRSERYFTTRLQNAFVEHPFLSERPSTAWQPLTSSQCLRSLPNYQSECSSLTRSSGHSTIYQSAFHESELYGNNKRLSPSHFGQQQNGSSQFTDTSLLARGNVPSNNFKPFPTSSESPSQPRSRTPQEHCEHSDIACDNRETASTPSLPQPTTVSSGRTTSHRKPVESDESLEPFSSQSSHYIMTSLPESSIVPGETENSILKAESMNSSSDQSQTICASLPSSSDHFSFEPSDATELNDSIERINLEISLVELPLQRPQTSSSTKPEGKPSMETESAREVNQSLLSNCEQKTMESKRRNSQVSVSSERSNSVFSSLRSSFHKFKNKFS